MSEKENNWYFKKAGLNWFYIFHCNSTEPANTHVISQRKIKATPHCNFCDSIRPEEIITQYLLLNER